MSDALINFNRAEFEALMEEQGLENATKGILLEATNLLRFQDNPITLDSLKSGEHPVLDELDRYSGLAPSERQLGPEEILTIFTNVEDYGKYDPQQDTSGTGEAILAGFGRMIPEGAGAYGGMKAGLTAVGPIASIIPPAGPAGIIARGIVYGVGGLGGSILGAITASELEDAVIGEAAPVVPSLEPAYRGGETTSIVASMIATPWKITPKIPKASTSALEYLENFKQLSSGTFKNVADEGFETFAKNAGLSSTQASNLLDTAKKARQVASDRGPMFGAPYGANLGFTRFNPAGFVTDPRKGPKTVRAIAAVEGGIRGSMEAARQSPISFGLLESARAVGTGIGAGGAQMMFPYSDVARVGGELLGSLVIPLPLTLTLEAVERGAPTDLLNKMKSWWGNPKNTEGFGTERLKKQGAKRIMDALRASSEYVDELDAAGEVVTADERLRMFIAALEEGAKQDMLGPDGKPAVLTVAQLSEELGLDFVPTLRTLQDELAKSSASLDAATDAGRASLLVGAENAISSLTATGDPAALAAAARIQQGLFEQNILDNLESGLTKLVDAANKVVGRDVQGGSPRTDLSKQLYKVLEQNIQQSKIRERELWSAKTLKNYKLTQFFSRNGREIQQPNVLQLLDRPEARGGLKLASEGAKENLNKAIGTYLADINLLRNYFQQGQGRSPATANRFFSMRSGILNNARQLRRKGDLENAGHLDRIADALLQDLTSQRDNTSVAYNNARAYTFARNNVFTRSFLQDLQTYDAQGGLRLQPEKLLDDMFQGGYNNVARKYDQIKAAGQFLIKEGGLTPEQVKVMETEEIMTAALSDSLSTIVDRKRFTNPATGEVNFRYEVNPTKLQNLKDKPGYKELVRLLPDLEDDLANAQNAQNAFDNILLTETNKIKPSEMAKLGFDDEQIATLYGTNAMKTVLGGESPSRAVAKALSGSESRPTVALNALYRMVDNTDPKDLAKLGYTKQQAMQGLTQAIFKHAWNSADSGPRAAPNGDVLQSVLFRQIPNAAPNVKLSLSDWMISKGLAVQTKEQLDERLAANANIVDKSKQVFPVPVMDDVQEAINRLRGVEEAFATGNFEQILFKNPSLSKLAYVRIVGATAGGFVQNKLKQLLGLPQLSGGLIAEQTGSELVQRVLLKGPESQRIKVMSELFANPKALSAFLKEIKDDEDLDKAVKVLEKFVSPAVRQTAVRFPILVRETIEEDIELEEESEPMFKRMTPEEREEFERVRFPSEILEERRRPASPPPVSAVTTPTPVAAPATSPVRPMVSAPLQPRPIIASAPQQPVDRARFAAFFPDDSASAMIRQQTANQGIGSLMG